VSDELLVKIGEGARRCDVSERTMRRLVFEGTVRSVKVGRRRLIPVTALQEYVDALQAEQDDDRQAYLPAAVSGHHQLSNRGIPRRTA
jgi:excisionase family DNA binding protein